MNEEMTFRLSVLFFIRPLLTPKKTVTALTPTKRPDFPQVANAETSPPAQLSPRESLQDARREEP